METANFGVEKWLNKQEKKAVYGIARNSIEALTLDELVGLGGTDVSEFSKKRKNESLDYGWTEGSDALKQEVASLYQTVDPKNTLQTNGVTGANLLTLYTSVEAGDRVVSMLLIYQRLYDIPESSGTTADFVHLEEEKDWQFDLEQLEALVRPEAKTICLNSADSPTGILLDRKALEEIAEVTRTVDAYILIDEVYAPLMDKGEFLSIVDIYEKGIATSSLFKTYPIPGIRTGWAATRPELAKVFRKCRDYAVIYGGVLSGDLVIHALKSKEEILERNQKIVTESLAILKQWVVNEPKVELVAPGYVFTSSVKLTTEEGDQAFCINLLGETGVLSVSGSASDLPEHVRLGYCCEEETLEKGLSLLSELLKKQA